MENMETFPTIKAQALVVEDNEGWINYFKQVIASKDIFFEFSYAKDLKSSLGLIKKMSFQLVILDLMLPDSTGIDTVRAVTDACQFVPVVVLTSLNDAVLQEDSMETGIEDYLIKGEYDEKLFFHVAHQAIRRCLAKNDRIQKILDRLRQLEKLCENL